VGCIFNLKAESDTQFFTCQKLPQKAKRGR